MKLAALKLFITLVLAFLLAAVADLSAQKLTLQSRMEVRFNEAPAAEVFRFLTNGLEYELALDPAVAGPVTIWVRNVTARTALDVVCESLGCRWRVDGKRLVVEPGGPGLVARAPRSFERVETSALKSRLSRPLPADARFANAPVSTVLRALSDASGMDIQAEEPFASQLVTLDLSGQTVETALKALIEKAKIDAKDAGIALLAGKGEAHQPAKLRIMIRTRPRQEPKSTRSP